MWSKCYNYIDIHCDLDLENSKDVLFAWHTRSRWRITIPSLGQKSPTFQMILSGWTLIQILNLCYNIDVEYSSHILHKTHRLLVSYHQTKLDLKEISISSEDIQSHVLIMWALTVTLTLTIASFFNLYFFVLTPRLMKIHHCTKFGYDRLIHHRTKYGYNRLIHHRIKYGHNRLIHHRIKFGYNRLSSSENSVRKKFFVLASCKVKLILHQRLASRPVRAVHCASNGLTII